MTQIETTIVESALSNIGDEITDICKALTIEGAAGNLDADLGKYLWNRITTINRQIRRAEQVIESSKQQNGWSDVEPANDWRGALTL